MSEGGTDAPNAGRLAGRIHRLPVRVYFEDTDAAGIVYYANYLRFMERGRSEMLRAVGVDQRATMEAGGGVYVVAEVRIRYRQPARIEDALVIETEVQEVRAASVVIHQRVMRGTELLADATVVAAFMSPDGRPRRQPKAWLDKFKPLAKGEEKE